MCSSMSVRNRPLSPVDFCLLHLTIHKIMFSVLLTNEDNGKTAQFKQCLVHFLVLQSIDYPFVTHLNFVIGPAIVNTIFEFK